jgi:hypothetical protein
MEKWPEETVRMALDGELDLERISTWRRSNPELYPLSEETAARLAERSKAQGK